MTALFWLLGAGRWIGRALRAIPWQVWGIAAGLALVWFGLHRIEAQINDARLEGYAAGVVATDAKWTKAQAEADRLQAAVAARTVQTQAAITYEVDNEATSARAVIDRRADALRLRHAEAANRRRGQPQPAGLPSTAEAARIADAEGNDGLSWDAAFVALKEAQAQQAQLNALIDWVQRQSEVEP